MAALVLTEREAADVEAMRQRHNLAALDAVAVEVISPSMTVYHVAPAYVLHVRRCHDDNGVHIWTWIEYFHNGYTVDSFKSLPI
jgi:hypothetical protein